MTPTKTATFLVTISFDGERRNLDLKLGRNGRVTKRELRRVFPGLRKRARNLDRNVRLEYTGGSVLVDVRSKAEKLGWEPWLTLRRVPTQRSTPKRFPDDRCEGCENLPGVLVGVNGNEVQRCDTCRPTWSDEDAADRLREAFPWVPVVFAPDDNQNTDGQEIGVYVIDGDALQIPDDAPRWLVNALAYVRER